MTSSPFNALDGDVLCPVHVYNNIEYLARDPWDTTRPETDWGYRQYCSLKVRTTLVKQINFKC